MLVWLLFFMSTFGREEKWVKGNARAQLVRSSRTASCVDVMWDSLKTAVIHNCKAAAPFADFLHTDLLPSFHRLAASLLYDSLWDWWCFFFYTFWMHFNPECSTISSGRPPSDQTEEQSQRHVSQRLDLCWLQKHADFSCWCERVNWILWLL